MLRMRKLLLAVGGIFLVAGSMTVALTGGTASAQTHGSAAAAASCPYATNCGGLTSSSGSAPPGGTITLTGTGYSPGATVTLNLCGLETLTVTAGTTGGFTVTITIPTNAVPGTTCLITATGASPTGTLTTSTSVLITSGVTVPVTPTGEPWAGQLYWILAAGMGLAGFGLFEVGRRRRFRSNS